MYYKKPFIILNSAPSINYNVKFWKSMEELKKINLWFDNEKKLLKFLNNNFKNLIINWSEVLKSKTYNKVYKTLFATEKFNDRLFVNEIMKL